MELCSGDFEYPLDPGLIAQAPLADRDQSRLMVLDRACWATRGCGALVKHQTFLDLPDLLRPGDLLVLNDTRVIPAKFHCRRQSGRRIEGLFLKEPRRGRWQVLLKNAGRCKAGEVLALTGPENVSLELLVDLGGGKWELGVLADESASTANETQSPLAREVLERWGQTPLPPYIRRVGPPSRRDQADRQRYQTVYAAKPGAVAAPTAGLHFTENLLDELASRDILTAWVTLHVGLGTFAPVRHEKLTDHAMHAEWYDLPAATAGALNRARAEKRRVVAVGTTSVRVLETAGRGGRTFRQVSGWTDLFLFPPAQFHAVDALITNFHLPRSTLLMLVAAFCCPGTTDGLEMILAAYAQASRQGYRFYSYGDAMLIE